MNTKINRKEFLTLVDTLRNVNSWIHGKQVLKLETTCVKCLSFDHEKEICRVAKSRPPAKIIAYGCPEFESEDTIPY